MEQGNNDQNTQGTSGKPNEEPEVLQTESVKSEKEIPITDKDEGDKDTVKVNFMDKGFLKDFVGKKTVKSDEPTPSGKDGKDSKSSTKEETTDELRDRIKRDEESYQNQFTPEDFEEIAGFAIDLLDAAISTGLRVWAKDTKTRDYELDQTKKNKLAKQGKLILIKHKLKWSVEFVFLLSIGVFYAGPIQKARKRRQTLESVKTSSTTTSTTGAGGGNHESNNDSKDSKPSGNKPRIPKRPKGSKGSN